MGHGGSIRVPWGYSYLGRRSNAVDKLAIILLVHILPPTHLGGNGWHEPLDDHVPGRTR